jgi:acetyltransferase-like isoleucine patch superfamily enzyme
LGDEGASAAPASLEGRARDTHELVAQGGVRTYARYGPRHAARRAWALRGLSSRGPQVLVEPGVKVLRHPERVDLGGHVMLKEGVRLCPTNPGASIAIGDWTTVGHHTFIFAMDRIEIGADCLIAPFCYLIDNEHGLVAGELIREQPMSASAVRIGAGCWLGTGVVITKGVQVGEGAVIGARSVVTADVPPNSIAVGVPARVVGERPAR